MVEVLPKSRANSPSGVKINAMRGTVHLVQRPAGFGTMIGIAGLLMDHGVERTAESDVQLLEAAADAQHRHVAGDRLADQRQGDRVAPGILRAVGPVGGAVIVMHRDVGGTAGEEHRVEMVEQSRRRNRFPQSREESG